MIPFLPADPVGESPPPSSAELAGGAAPYTMGVRTSDGADCADDGVDCVDGESGAPHFNPAHSLDRAADAHPQRVSLWYGERRWSVREAAVQTFQLAQLLMEVGVRRGDRVAIVARNSPYHLLLYVALARIGAVFVPISYRLTRPELMRVVARLTPRALVADPETAVGALGDLPRVVNGRAGVHTVDIADNGRDMNAADTVAAADSGRAAAAGDTGGDHVANGAADGMAQLTSEALFVLDDDAQAQLPPELAPDPKHLERAVASGWRALSVAARSVSAETSSVSTTDNDRHHGSQRELRELPLRTSRHDAGLNNAAYPEGVGVIVLTSGSTGEPKLVPLTYENLWWGSRNFREGFEYSHLDVELVVAPLTHIGGFNGTTADLFSHGGTVVVVREFQPAVVLRELERRHVAIMFGVPTMYAALMREPYFASADLHAFRLPLIGGAAAPAQLLRELDAAGLHVLNVWGMTETSASGCYLPAELLADHAGAIGRPFAYIQARIVDPETGRDASGSQPRGELWLRGPSVVNRYWHDRQEHTADRSPWLHTGDMVRLDSEGYLWVIGRLHELINTGGEKVAPNEVMQVIAQYPGVSDVAVVGVPDPVWGEAVAAALILAPGATPPNLAQLRTFAASSLADFKLPRRVEIVERFPLNANGKLDREALVQLLSS